MKNSKEKKNNSEYQPPLNLNETSSNTGISSAFYDPIEVKRQNIDSDPENPIKNDFPPAQNPNISCFTMEYYQPFFDIKTIEVRNRILQSLIPIKSNFLETTSKNPDLYGPFWIYTTLIFAIAAAGNFSRYLKSDADAYEPDFNFVPVAAGLIYGIGFVVPILVCFLMRFFGGQIRYVPVICIYGYSYSCFIMVAFLCIIPNDGLEWGLILYGVVNSSIFLLINFWKELGNYIENKRYLIMGFVGGSQAVMFLTFKFYFFKGIYAK